MMSNKSCNNLPSALLHLKSEEATDASDPITTTTSDAIDAVEEDMDDEMDDDVDDDETFDAVSGDSRSSTSAAGGGGVDGGLVVCFGCRASIADHFYLVAVGKYWHAQCLRCDECRRPLDASLSCFARQSRIYCRQDYARYYH